MGFDEVKGRKVKFGEILTTSTLYLRPLLISSLFPEPDHQIFRSVGRSEKNYLLKIVKKMHNSNGKQQQASHTHVHTGTMTVHPVH